jgi:hypothetical protein
MAKKKGATQDPVDHLRCGDFTFAIDVSEMRVEDVLKECWVTESESQGTSPLPVSRRCMHAYFNLA